MRHMSDGDRRVAGIVVACALALGVVAVAAEGSLLRGPERADRLQVGSSIILAVVVILVMWVLFMIAVLVYSLTGIRGGVNYSPVRRRRTWQLLLLTLLALALLAVVKPASPQKPAEENSEQPEAPGVPSTSETRERSPVWPLGVAGLLLAGAFAAVALGRRGPDARPTREARVMLPPPPAVARQLFDASLEDLREEPDPRAAIIKAYQRLLDGLARHGQGRRPAEAPVEHLERALRALALPPRPLETLVELFVEARFSEHALGDAHKDAAIAAFERARDELSEVVPS
ncbi:MAG TPA: DUF4129 domain-containing protein [Acidimicrobiales bacterium]